MTCRAAGACPHTRGGSRRAMTCCMAGACLHTRGGSRRAMTCRMAGARAVGWLHRWSERCSCSLATPTADAPPCVHLTHGHAPRGRGSRDDCAGTRGGAPRPRRRHPKVLWEHAHVRGQLASWLYLSPVPLKWAA
eukprot:364053-Chlamydomonas_euryale.AAC.5